MMGPFKMMAILPKPLVDECKSKRHDPHMQTKMLHHGTNYVARHHYKKNTDALTPFCYLDLCTTEDQAKLPAPTVKDINMFEWNIASYSCLIISKEQMESM